MTSKFGSIDREIDAVFGEGFTDKEAVIDKSEDFVDKEAVIDKSDDDWRKEDENVFHRVNEITRESAKSYVDTLFFWDGIRKIDMVLPFDDTEDNTGRKAIKRRTFEKNLEEQGLELETEPKERSQDRKTSFLKIHAPWEILSRYAEILNLKMPIKLDDTMIEDQCPSFCDIDIFDYDHNIIPPEPSFFTAGFVRDREDKFIIKDRETFFTSAQRSQIVWQILMRTRYDDDMPEKVGILRLQNKNVYKAAYPLHEGRHDRDGPKGEKNDRRLLALEWANPKKWYKKQPLWLVKRYFGDKIGLYFAWLGFYNQMLVPAAVCGILVFLYGLITFQIDTYNQPSYEICKSPLGNNIMCPECVQYCNFTELNKSCSISRITYIFDNGGTVFFAIFMSFWASTFLELWKRRQAVIAWEWDLVNFDEEEQPRPEFESKVKTTRINPVTRASEAFLPGWNKAMRIVFTSAFALVLLSSVLIGVLAIMFYKIIIMAVMYGWTKEMDTSKSFLYKNTRLITSLSAACLNLLFIVILNKLYEYVAVWLVNMEHPRTQTDYEESFTIKMFLFQFINFYSSLIYIAFFRGKFWNSPKDLRKESELNNKLEAFTTDMCDASGCFYELSVQLLVIMVGKQIFNNIIEFFLPLITNWWKRYVYRSNSVEDTTEAGIKSGEKKLYTRWEQDYNLKALDRMALFEEYLEMVIQYGFVTLFVAAFPLAPFFALFNNVIETRLDAYKFTAQTRRPLAQRAQDIGAWYNILKVITYLSVVSNAFVIAHTSDFIPHMVYMYRGNNNSKLSLEGYVASSISVFNTSDWGPVDGPEGTWPGPEEYYNVSDGDLPKTCYFKGVRKRKVDDDGKVKYAYTEMWYEISAARLLFVAVFEHVVFFVVSVIAWIIPDVPNNVKIQIQREKLLERETLFDNQFRNLQHHQSNISLTSVNTVNAKNIQSRLKQRKTDSSRSATGHDGMSGYESANKLDEFNIITN